MALDRQIEAAQVVVNSVSSEKLICSSFDCVQSQVGLKKKRNKIQLSRFSRGLGD